jgi:hypothetical protein
MSTTFKFTAECIEADSCTVFFEPEGGHVELARGQMITVEISGGTPPAEPEIAFVPSGIIIGAWSGALTTAWDSNGERLDI